MIHKHWQDTETIKQVECIHTNAKKYVVNTTLTPGKIYDVKNETEEFIFIIDNSNRVGAFRKDYFKEV
ncbi:hypothetical protein SAMN04489762_0650 [Terribacillus saccharophilus]|uniref:Uncharacterized protein n=1 Tax=Terribacillus saccharophilus TaxID=361277 RepID=A0AAX2EC01_9BACI|nr:DUF6501 family protein [Terribacillus saccharophilus]MCM3224717.1 DUF6501 family protein [Terribacillus saccharophilus]SEM64872.1 hypothetical protein SAMN04489762_0650 [Terribacillus saccharophilus]